MQRGQPPQCGNDAIVAQGESESNDWKGGRVHQRALWDGFVQPPEHLSALSGAAGRRAVDASGFTRASVAHVAG